MASRRDELNAYTFAKRRTVAAFLQPSATGTEEGAPRPLRAVLPGVVMAAVVLAAFGAWGMFKPTAPKGWDAPGAQVIVGKQSTTRYVVLTTKVDGKDQTRLHPVLNLASARLLLDPSKAKVVQVEDKVLDAGKLPRGPIIGIPYAPDRLPAPAEAAKAKRWAVCQQPGGNGRGVQTATFVLAEREAKLMDDAHRLSDTQALYVQSTGPAKGRYLIDAAGTKYRFPEGSADASTMTNALVGGAAVPQPVTDEWLATLDSGEDLAFPQLPGGAKSGTPAGVKGLASADDKVGMVLMAMTGSGTQHYLVLPGKVVPVSGFVAWLMISSPATDGLDMHGKPREVDLQSINPDPVPFKGDTKWPQKKADRVNEVRAAGAAGAEGDRDTVCSVLRSVDAQGNQTVSTWAGTGFPVDITASGTSAYVTPGTGLLYTQAQGRQTTAGGALFLVTDTGLRYAVQANGDSDAAQPSPGASASASPGAGPASGQSGPTTSDGRPAPSQAQARLGYASVVPVTVPIAWSEFLSKGPRLDSNSARQPQGS